MKVYIQIVDTRNGISQHGMIEEPVSEGLEISNALGHFGVNYGYVKWCKEIIEDDVSMLMGKITDTTKLVTVITIQVVYDQPSHLGENRSLIEAILNKMERLKGISGKMYKY